MILKRFISLILSVSTVFTLVNCVNAVDETSIVYEDAISVCEYSNGYAQIGGVVAPNSNVTIEVEYQGGFDTVVDGSFSSLKLKKALTYFRQVESNEFGKYNIRWLWKPSEISDGVYGVKVYSALDHKTYTSQINIGKADLACYSVKHWGVNDAGQMLRANTKLAVQADVNEFSGASGSVALITTKYDASGTLINTAIDYGIANGNATTQLTTYTDIEANDNSTVKAFVWDSESGMRPLGKNAEFSLGEVYVAPTAEQVYSDLISYQGGEQVHPRMLGNTAVLDAAKERYLRNDYSYYAQRFDRFISFCDDFEGCEYEIGDGIRLTGDKSYNVIMYQMGTYGLAAYINKESNPELSEEYFQKAWKTIYDISEFPDWNPNHFLDIAHISRAYAEGFDLFYDYLSDEQKQYMINTAVEKAFNPVLQDYLEQSRTRTFYWSRFENTNNWNLVVNSSIISLALAMVDEPAAHDACMLVLDLALSSIGDGLGLYYDGEWAETVSYWSFATKYLSVVDAALDNSCGTDYGISSVKGLRQSFDFIMSLLGSSSSMFNFGEGDAIAGETEMYYLANKYNYTALKTFLNWQNYYDGDKRGKFSRPYTMLWYDGDAEGMLKEYPLQMFAPVNGVAVMRADTTNAYFNTWNGNSAMSVCLKTGKNSASHSQLDKGSFILDYECARYIWDLGKDINSYSPPSGVSKWYYYRNRAEGNNTLVINPNQGYDQDLDAVCPLTNYGADEAHAFAITNLTDAYDSKAKSVRRGITLTDNRTVTIIRDEMNLKKPSDVYWQMHYKVVGYGYNVTISDDGKKAWIPMTSHGVKYLEAKIIDGPEDAKFEIMEAVPFDTTPYANNVSNTGYKKLVIHLSNYSGGTLMVGIAPTLKNADYTFTDPGSLDDWN